MPDLPTGKEGADVSEAKVAELAGFGPAPENILGAPGYAMRVMSRQKELKETIADINDRMSKAEAERDGAEATLGQAAMDFGLVPDAAREIEAKVAEAEKSISAARGRTDHETEQHKEELARLDGELKQVRDMLEPLVQRERIIADEVSAAETHHRRAAAVVQRSQIQIRNLESGKGSVMPGDDPAGQLAQLKSQLAPQQAQANEAAQKLAAVQKEETGLKSQMSPLRKKQQKLEEERQASIDAYEEAMGERSAEAKRANAWRRSRLAVAGRQVYDQKPRPRLTDGDRLFARIDASRQKVKNIQAELDLHLRALDAFDAEAVGQAKLVLYGAIGVVLLILVILIALR